MDMNDFRKVAEYVRTNGITVKKKEIKGTAGGFDDYTIIVFYKDSYEICTMQIDGFHKIKIDPIDLLRTLKSRSEELNTVSVFDLDTLVEYLSDNHLIEDKE